MAAALAALVLLTSCSAGPVIVWHGRSPDRAHAASIVEEAGGQRLVLDGAPHAPFEAIGFTHLAWSDRGPVYPARADGRWHVVVGGEPGPSFDAIGDIAVSGDHVAYCAERDGAWHVVAGGEVGPAFRSLRAASLAFAGDRAVYVARDDQGERAVIGGTPGPEFDHVGRVIIGAKGRLVAYAAEAGDRARIVIEDRASEPVDQVLALVVADDEPRWAAIVREGDAFKVLHDGRPIATPTAAADVCISPDGTRVAWTEVGARVEVVVGGQEVGSHAGVEQMRFVPRTNALLYVAHEEDGVHVVHAGVAGPRLRSVDAIVTSGAGHWGYVAEHGVGHAVIIDGVARYRGEWAGALTLAERGDRWAFVVRRAGRRFVVSPERRVPVEAPMVDTLVLDAEGRRWALAVADRRARRIEILVDGRAVAELDLDEVSAAVMQGRDPVTLVRQIVAAELTRSAR